MSFSSEIYTLRLSLTPQNLTCEETLSRSIKLAVIAIFSGVFALSVVEDRTVVAQDLKDDSGLSQHLAKKLTDQVLPHLQSGDYESFIYPLAKIISTVPAEVYEEIETFGQSDSGISFRIEFFKAWQSVVLSGDLPNDFKFKRTVLMYLVSGAVAEIQRMTEEIENDSLMTSDKVPADWRDSRYFFLGVEELKIRIDEFETMGMFLNQALEPYRNTLNAAKGTEEALEKFQIASESFAETKKQVIEKEAVLRLQRFNVAAQELLQPNDFEEGFTFALFLEEDIAALETFFNNVTDIQSLELNGLGIKHEIVQTIGNVKASGNPIIEKASLFTKGLDQWRRGRYGMGPAGHGLLKSKTVGGDLNGLRAKLANRDLRMPETLAPISQFLGVESGEGYDRKHYYTWDLEYRPLRRSYGTSSSNRGGSRSSTASPWGSQELICTNGTPYTQNTRNVNTQQTIVNTLRIHTYSDFDPQDDTIPPRIVGTYEYKTSLKHLDKLVLLSTPEEIEVYDKIIAQLPEFIFYSGMTANINQPLNANGLNPQPPAANDFKKQSLAWMMALARVELSATRSMYLPGDNWFVMPFTATFGQQEYYSVLLDDMAVHLHALETDGKFKKAVKKSMELASSATISYLRRLKLIDSGLAALERSGAPVVVQKSIEFRTVVKKYTDVLQDQVARSVQDTVQSTTSQKTTNSTNRQVVNKPH